MKTENLRKFVEWAWDFIMALPCGADVLPEDWESDDKDNLVVKGAFEELEAIENGGEWIKTEDQKPPMWEKVQVYWESVTTLGEKRKIVSEAYYLDGTVLLEDFAGYDDETYDWLKSVGAKYNAEKDDYYMPEGWYQIYPSLNTDRWVALDESEKVMLWKPMPELPKKGER